MSTSELDNPILNSPYEAPDRYFAIDPNGPTGEVLAGRRKSESFIPIPVSRKGKKEAEQDAFDFDLTGERREENALINDIRYKAEIDEDAWASLYLTVSRAFPKPATGKIAVKVIYDYGDEVLQVFELAGS